jgi:hypothetical protein
MLDLWIAPRTACIEHLFDPMDFHFHDGAFDFCRCVCIYELRDFPQRTQRAAVPQ